MLKRIVGKVFLVYAVLIAVVISLALSSNNSAEVFAISKEECGLKSENGEFTKDGERVSDAVKWACDKISGGSTSRWGVVWFNSTDSEDRHKQDYVVKGEFSEADKSSDDTDMTITAWLHGQFYSGSNGGRKRDGMDAWAIRFVKPENYKDADEEDAEDVFYYYKNNSDGTKTCERYTSRYDDKTYCHPDDTIDFLNNFGTDTILYRGASDSSTDKACDDSDTDKKCIKNNTWSKSGPALRLEINTKKMTNEGNNYCLYDDTTNTYTCTVGMYRCPHTSITSDNHAKASSTCGTDNGKIIITEFGQTFGRMKLKTGPVGDNDPQNTVAVTYKGAFTDYGYTGHSAETSFNPTNQIGVIPVIVPTATVKVVLGLNDKIKFNFHSLLDRSLDSVKGEYATCYVYADSSDAKNCVKATERRNLKPSNTIEGKQVDFLKIYGKTDGDGNVQFTLDDDVAVPYNDNKFCYALFYKNKDSDLPVTQGRAICVEIEVTKLEGPKLEGRIVMNAASASVSDGATDGATAATAALITSPGKIMTGWESDGNPDDEIKTLPSISLESGVSTDVYGHWSFSVRSEKSAGTFQTRRLECRSKSDACVDWIKDIDIVAYKNISSEGTVQDGNGNEIWINRIKSTDNELSSDYTRDTGKPVKYVEDRNTSKIYEDKLKGESKYTVCYKYFVANNSAHLTEADKVLWNESVACFKASSGTSNNDPQGEVKMVFKSSDYSGCSVQQNNASSTNASTSGSTTVKREISKQYNDMPTFVDIQCTNDSIDSVDVTFSHDIYSDNPLEKKSAHYQAKHKENATQEQATNYSSNWKVFYDKKLPETAAGPITRFTKKSKKSGTSFVDGGTGKYTLGDGDGYTCEGLFANGDINAVICVRMTKDTPPPSGNLSGYSQVEITSGASNCERSSAKVNTASGRPEETITCTGPVTAKFTHYTTSNGSPLVTKTRHHLYYNPDAGNGSVRPYHDHYFNVGWNSTETIANSRSVSANMTCESQWYGANESALTSKVCVEIKPTINASCDILEPTAFSKASGTSAIASGVMNMTTANGIWGTEILAKPTDQIQFMHCYFTGAQATKTTKYWDILNSNEHKPTLPSTKDGCAEQEYKQGEDVPSGCSPAPSFSLLPSSSSCTSGDWSNCDGESWGGYTVDTNELETLNEATYLKNKSEDNKYLDTYSIATTYPGSHGLGIGTSSTRDRSLDYGYSDYIGMKYTGKSSESGKDAGFNDTTVGNPGVVGFGIAENNNDVFIAVGAPGGTLSQSISAYTGTVARKQHSQTWSFYIGYKYPVCMFAKKGDGYAETCTKDTKSVSSTDTSNRGSGSGNHGSIYYERDDTKNYTYETKTASVYVQYNYQNTAKVEIDPATKIYAGESFRLKNAFVYVNPIYNNLTSGTYATIAPDVDVQLYAYISDTDQSSRSEARTSDGSTSHTTLNGCDYYLSGTGLPCETIDYDNSKTFNTQGKYGGTNNEYKEKAFPTTTYNAFDYIAGRYLCVGLGMNKSKTHAVSYSDRGTEVEDWNIYYSQPSCSIIYKKPTFAVWGGSLFSNGDIEANILDKRNVANYTPYQNKGTAYRISFSSWVEGIVVGNSDIKGLASGAATAYTFAGDSSNNYAPIAAPGGIDTGDYCILSALTIANESCAGKVSGNADVGNAGGVKEDIATRFIDPFYNLETNSLNKAKCRGDGRKACELVNGNLGDISVSYGETAIYASKNSITINKNVTIPETYISANQIPQVIIYTEGDINIAGNVTRIDAILVAGGKINTCAEYDSVKGTDNEYICHNQLRINGATLANTLELNRLYGASVGSYSVEPAEIINQSPAQRIWSTANQDRVINEDLSEVYTRELAPRQ